MVASVCAEGQLAEFPSWACGGRGAGSMHQDRLCPGVSHLGLIRRPSANMPGTEGMSTRALAGVHTQRAGTVRTRRGASRFGSCPSNQAASVEPGQCRWPLCAQRSSIRTRNTASQCRPVSGFEVSLVCRVQSLARLPLL